MHGVRKILPLVVWLAVWLGAWPASIARAEGGGAPVSGQAQAQGSNAFGLDVYRKLPAKGNLAYSPASLSAALAMTYGGSNGATAQQMRKVLHITEQPAQAMESAGKLLGSIV